MDPLGALIADVAGFGALGLFALSMLERLLPVLPSYALLVAVGIAAGMGHWTLPTALLVSAAGGLLGCLCVYAFGFALGEGRALRLLGRIARALGVSGTRFDALVHGLHARGSSLAFVAQMVPTVRFVAPGIAGALRVAPRSFASGTALGVFVWNSLFIAVGYGAGAYVRLENASTIAVMTLLVVIAAELLLAAAWNLRRRAAAAEVRDARA